MTERNENVEAPAARSTIDTLFGIDARTLAFVRISLAVLMLIDLALRSRMIEVFYTDAGALPRAKIVLPALFGVYGWSGSYAVQAGLLALHAVVVVLFLVGWRTRIVTVVLYVLLGSLISRNPLIADGQDVIPSQILLWSMFLPMGARWSVDALHGRGGLAPGQGRVLSVATAALTLQFVLMYVTTGLVKSGVTWQEWTAVLYSVSNDNWVRDFGLLLRRFPTLMIWMAPATLFLETVVPLFVLLPRRAAWIRGGVIAAFVVFQAGLWLSIELRLFPFMSTVLASVLIPAAFWDWLAARFAKAWLESAGAETSRGAEGVVGRIQTVAVSGLLIFAVLICALEVGRMRHIEGLVEVLEPLEVLAYGIGLRQAWNMYGPDPATVSIRTEVEGITAKGRVIPLLESQGSPSWARARSMQSNYKLRYFLEKISWKEHRHADLRHDYLMWVCRRWNAGAAPEDVIVQVRGASIMQRMLVDPPPPPRRISGQPTRCPPPGD